MLKRILLALSGTECTPIAVRRAVELAKRHGASITAVTVVDIDRMGQVGPVPIGGGSAARDLAQHRVAVTQEHIEEEIARFEKACRDASVPYVLDRETGDPFELLLGLWRYHDLTIIGMRGLFEYGVVHNPDDQVLKLIRSGVRPIIGVSSEFHEVTRVLVAYDGSPEAAVAIKRFAQLQMWLEAKVKIVCFGFEEAKATPLLTDASEYLRAHAYQPEAESIPGRPKAGVVAQAKEWDADLVVMGATYRGRIAKLFLGPTPLEVVMHAGLPLFLSR